MDSFVIRYIKIDDKEYVVEMLQDPDVMRYIGPRRALNEQEALKWFSEELDLRSRFAIALKSSDELIGFCGVKEIDGVLDFGYFLRKRFWGQGYATNICERVLEMIRSDIDLETLQVFIAKENKASLAVARKLSWKRLREMVKDNEKGYLYRLT